jgi:RNA polymerase sigma factor (sigma-70 family)
MCVDQAAGDPRSDAELLAASRGEPDAFLVVFERHVGRITGYVGRRVGREQAEDLVSEVFLRAFAHRDRYDGGKAEVLPWLYGIATNILREHHRKEERELRALARAHALGSQADRRESVDEWRASLAPHLARGLLALPPADRDALLLLAWGELGYEEIAEALDIPVGTVKSRINRARARLRESLRGAPSVEPWLAQKGVSHG